MDVQVFIDLLYSVPTDVMVGTFLEQAKAWYIERTLLVTPAVAAFGWLAYKTPWSWDNKLVAAIKKLFGIGARERDGEQIIDSERSTLQRDDKEESV